MTNNRAFSVNCLNCEGELAPWFDAGRTMYDVAQDDDAYERWLDTPCSRCKRTPRDNMTRTEVRKEVPSILTDRGWLREIDHSDESRTAIALLWLLESEIQSCQIALSDYRSATREMDERAKEGPVDLSSTLPVVFHHARVFIGSVRRAVVVLHNLMIGKRGQIFASDVGEEVLALWQPGFDGRLFEPYRQTRNALEHKWEEVKKQKSQLTLSNLHYGFYEFAPGKSAAVSEPPVERLIAFHGQLIEIYKRAWPTPPQSSVARTTD